MKVSFVSVEDKSSKAGKWRDRDNEVKVRRDGEIEWLRLRADLQHSNSDGRDLPKAKGGAKSTLKTSAAANAEKTSDAAASERE